MRHRHATEDQALPTQRADRSFSFFAVASGAIIGLAILFVLGALAVMNALGNENRARQVADSAAAVIQSADALLLAVVDMETGQRGYLLTEDALYLDIYLSGRARVAERLDAFEAALDAAELDPGKDRIAHVRELVARRMAIMAGTVRLQQEGRNAGAVALVKGGSGKVVMDAIRADLDGVKAAQRDRLARADARTEASRRQSGFLLGALAFGVLGVLLLGVWLARRGAAGEAWVQYLSQIAAERDRADLISRELSHRVKNLFAIIMSIISVTARTETDPRVAARKTRERVQALSRAHELSTGRGDVLRSARIGDLVQAVVGPYAPVPERLETQGPDLTLPGRLTTPLGLILNELATNALKYGAWRGSEGTVTIIWELEDNPSLAISWAEAGHDAPPAPPAGTGFGTTMIELSVRQAGGEIERHWQEDGLTVNLRFDMTRGEGRE